jgi:HD-like signal output (HDOD) protein
MLGRNWQLPDLVTEAIRLHHDFDVVLGRAPEVSEPVRALVCVSALADKLAAEFLGFDADIEWALSGAAVLDYLGLDEGEIDEIRIDVADDLAEMVALRN